MKTLDIQACYVLNLDRRPDRWARFLDRLRALPAWPLAEPERFPAVDGETVDPPAWWTESRGAWGCFQSHVAMWQRARDDRLDNVLILEDDVFWVDRFASRLEQSLTHVPDDWHQVYLGGQHLRTDRVMPQPVNPWTVRCLNTGRTHAYLLRAGILPELLGTVCGRRWNLHIDNLLASLHQARRFNHYAPREWLFGQVAGRSDVCIQGETGTGLLARTELWQLPELRDE